ncbi:MAG: M23 family metallopeptidase, partial [Anaerolineales bacterium]|nr:M23 family metallopeptidase [Anaerolineales bacterium]
AWDRNEPLLLGPAGLVYTPLQATPRRQTRREGQPNWLLTAGGLGALAFVALCLIAAGIFAYTRFGPEDGLGPLVENDNGPATPTLAPTRFNELQITRPDGQVQIVTVTPPPTISTADCAPAVVAEDNSFLDLPFPYRGIDPIFGGSGDEFRRISQRTRFGGRINSFFDHEYPVYPPAFGGWEPVGIDLTMVLFDGTRSTDAFVQDAVDGDWYSGHAGIDFAPVNPLREDTPILAAAAGRLQLVTIYDDGNHAIWLTHDPDGDGTYQYATLYFHIFPDQYWDDMMARYLAANDAGTFVEIAAGERIGTMGTTGRSTGIHLHFEVRHDVNRPFGTFDQYEKVDPYGFFPGEDVEVDPWSEPVTWIDTKGVEREHSGVTSDYLWSHPLVEVDANDAAVSCVIDIRYSADIRGLIGWTVIDPGFTVAIRNQDGQIVARGEPQTRRVTIRAEELVGVNLDSVSLDYFEPEAGVWVTVGTAAGLVQQANGDYTYTASVDRTGQYVLVAEQSVDFVPPTTRIELDGNRLPGGNNYFQGSVSVSLNATDAGLPAPSGVDTIQYSLDCGDTWQTYTAPFTVTAANMGACGTGVSDQGLQLGDNELLLLAIASDKNGNIEQPASQMFIAVTP